MSRKARAIQQLFDTVSLGAPEKAIGFVLWRVVHRYVREVDRAMIPFDLTHLQFTTLAMTAWLGRLAQPVTQAEIARFSDIQPMQISHMLKELERKCMVARTRDPSDVRAKRIEVTGLGINALRGALPAAIAVQQQMFGSAGRTGGALLELLLRSESATEKL